MIAAIGAVALLSINFTGIQPVTPMEPSIPPVQARQSPNPSVLVVLVNGDGSLAGEIEGSKSTTRVEVQIFEENTASDTQVMVSPDEKPLAQSFVWMRNLAIQMLERASNAKSRSHPCSTISGFEKLVIVREVCDEEAQSTEPAEQRAERAITGILGG